MVELIARQDGERRGEQGALAFVADITVLRFPVFQRGASLGQVEDALAGVVPERHSVVLLERMERGALRLVKPLHDSRIFVTIPAPGGSLDASRRQHSSVGQEPLKAFLVRSV